MSDTKFPDYYPSIKDVQKNTGFKTDIAALGALETLYWLENGAPHKFDGLEGKFAFDMGSTVYIYDDEEKEFAYASAPSCGTACCIAGAVEVFQKKGIKEQINDGIDTIVTSLSDEEHNLDDRHNLYNLFMGNYTYPLELIKPKEGYKVLFHYLTTGEVDWKNAFSKKRLDKFEREGYFD